MTRTVLAAALAAAALLAPSASAANGPAVLGDPKGDWPVASSDMLSARVEGVVSGAKRSVRATMMLAAAPDAPTEYQVSFGDACDSWDLAVRGIGTAAETATFTHYVCDSTQAAGTTDAAVKVTGSKIELTAPYLFGLRRGIKVTGIAAAASVKFFAVGVDMGDPNEWIVDGDLAVGNASYVLP